MRAFAYLLLAMSISTAANAQEPPKADNSAQNRGALRSDAVTAQKQDNKKHDLKVLASVRKTIMRQKGLSMYAKNIKILSQNGIITLAGPVKSDDEKAKVCALAKTCGGVMSVVDELTVAPTSH